MTDLSLVTPRLRLRPLVVADAAAMWPDVTDPAVPHYMTWEPHRDLSETLEFLAFCETSLAEGRAATLGIVEPDDTFVRVAGLHDITPLTEDAILLRLRDQTLRVIPRTCVSAASHAHEGRDAHERSKQCEG